MDMRASDQHNSLTWKFPRTTREVGGYYVGSLRKSFSFRREQGTGGSLLALVVAVLLLVGFLMGSR